MRGMAIIASCLAGCNATGGSAMEREILEKLDANDIAYFPFHDHEKYVHGAARLHGFSDGTNWAIVIQEFVDWVPVADFCETRLYVYGSNLLQRPNDSDSKFFVVSYTSKEPKNPKPGDSMLYYPTAEIEGLTLPSVEPTDPDLNIKVNEHLLEHHRDRLYRDEESIRKFAGELPLILVLDDWNHPHERPSASPTFQMIAKALATQDKSRYAPTLPSNF